MKASVGDRLVIKTHYRVRRLLLDGDASEQLFDDEAAARGHEVSLVGAGHPGTLVLLERMDLAAGDDHRPDHYETTAIGRSLC